MGSVRNKRHAGRQQPQQQHQHQATKKRKQQKQRQDLRLTIALTKSGGVELKGRLKKPRKGADRTDQMSGAGQRDSVSPDPDVQQRSESASAELKAEEEQGTTSSSSPPPPPQDLHGDDATSDHESNTTVDANSLVTMETVPEHRATKKVVMATKSEEDSDAAEEEEDQQKKDEDYEKLRQSDDQSEVDGDGGLSVTCGENVARLYLSKLRLIARERVQSQCIRFDGSWLTPNEFQRESGREAAKDWKRTIRHNGLCLKQLLSDGIFDFSVSPPVCLCVTCAAAAAAATRRGCSGATTNEEMEITARHPSPAFDEEEAAAAATPDQEECLISGLGSATAAAAAAAASYRSGDGDKKEKRRRRSKQRPVKEKRKAFPSSSSSSACALTDDSAMLRSPDNATPKRKISSCQFDRPTAELLTDGAETFERLAAKTDEMTEKSDALTKQHLDGVTTLTDQTTLETDGMVATTTDLVSTKFDGVAVDATPGSELLPAVPLLEAPDGDTKCHAQEPGLIPKKKRRKKNRKNFSSIEASKTQQVNNRDFVQADSHSFIDPKIPDDRWSSKENQALQELAGKAVTNHVKQDGCNVEASVSFQALSICGEVQKQQTCGLNDDQQMTDGKYEKIVDGSNICDKELSAEDGVIRNPNRLDSNEMATSTDKSPSLVNSSEDDYKKRDLSSSQCVSLNEENAHTETEFEGHMRDTKKSLDNGDIPRDLLSSMDEEICSQQPDMDGSPLDKSEIDSVLCESIHNIPTMPLSKEGDPCLKTDLSDDRLIPPTENLPVTPDAGVQPGVTATSDQSAGTATVSEAPTGGLPANIATSRNPHLVAVIAELKQKKQLALTSGVKKQNDARQSVFNSDESKGTTGVSCQNANDTKLSFDVASRFLAAAANPSLSFSPPLVDTAPLSSTSGLCEAQTLQQSSGSSADLTRSTVISKAAEGQSGSSVSKHKTKTTSGGRSESNRKRSCRPSTAEGKASKALDGGKHVTSGKDFNPSIPLSLPSGLYGLSPSQLASLPFPASPYSLFPPYLFMGFPLQPLLPSCSSSDGKLPSFGMAQNLAAASATSDQPPAQPPPPASRKRRSNQSGKSPSQKTRRGSQTTTSGATAGTNPMAAIGAGGSDKTFPPATSDLLNSMMAFDLLRSRIGMSPPVGPGLDSPKSAPFYFPWLKPDPSKPDVLFGGGGGPSSSSLLRTMTSDAKLQQAATRTLAAPSWSDAFARQHEQHPKRPKTGDFRPYDPMSCVVDKKATPTPPLFSPDFKISRRRDKTSVPPSTDQKPFSLAASEHSSVKNQFLPESHFYDDVGALDLSLK